MRISNPVDASRLDEEDEFVVEAEEAQSMLPKKVPVSKLRDYRDIVGHSMVRADTIRRFHPNHTAAQGLDGHEDRLVEALTRHPSALTDHPDLNEPVFDEEQQEFVEGLLDPDTGPVEGEEVGVLIQQDGLDNTAKTVSIGSRTWYGDLVSPKRKRHTWPTETVREIVGEWCKNELRCTANDLQDRPQERSTAQHVEELGIERLVRESPYFAVSD